MEKKVETTIIYWGNIRVIVGLYWDNGKENGNYYSILEVYMENVSKVAMVLRIEVNYRCIFRVIVWKP